MVPWYRDRFLLGCMTAIILTGVAALTTLFALGRSQEAFRIVTLIAQGIGYVVVTYGVVRTKRSVEDAKSIAVDTQQIAVSNHASITDGTLKAKVKESIEEAITEWTQTLDMDTTQPPNTDPPKGGTDAK